MFPAATGTVAVTLIGETQENVWCQCSGTRKTWKPGDLPFTDQPKMTLPVP